MDLGRVAYALLAMACASACGGDDQNGEDATSGVRATPSTEIRGVFWTVYGFDVGYAGVFRTTIDSDAPTAGRRR